MELEDLFRKGPKLSKREIIKKEMKDLHDLRATVSGFSKKKTLLVIMKIFNNHGDEIFDHPWMELLRKNIEELESLIVKEKGVSLKFKNIFEKETRLDEKLKTATGLELREFKKRGTSKTTIAKDKNAFKEEVKNQKYAKKLKGLLKKLKQESKIQEINIKLVEEELRKILEGKYGYKQTKERQEILNNMFEYFRKLHESIMDEDKKILPEIIKNSYVKEKILEHIGKDLWQTE